MQKKKSQKTNILSVLKAGLQESLLDTELA